MWTSCYIENSTGSEGGVILKDEEYKGQCHITLEKCPEYYAITCGIYSGMFHTTYRGEKDFLETYESMKKDLQTFIDSGVSGKEEDKFYDDFTLKY